MAGLTTIPGAGKIWIMSKIQKSSTSSPLDSQVVMAAIDFILKAEAMGLLDEQVDTLNLNLDAIIFVAKKVASEGLGRKVVIDPERWREYSSTDLRMRLNELSSILEDSPLPEREWSRVKELLQEDLMTGMLHISEPSLRRYAQGERQCSDNVSNKLHWLALVLGDLLGSYNEIGARNWFLRPRKSFGGKTPFQMLSARDWNPDDAGPIKIREFVKSLNGAMGT